MSLKNKTLNYDLLPLEQLTRYQLPNAHEVIDYSSYIPNNFIKPSSEKNRALWRINEFGGAVWLGHNGHVFYRISQDEDIIEFTDIKTAERALASYLNKNDFNFFKGSGSGKNYIPADIEITDLIQASDKFTPFARSEFYMMNNKWYRTSFIPSTYLARRFEKGNNVPVNILKLLNNLVDGNAEYLEWMLNWLACFFQTLKKSQVALVLRGDQGAGKGLIFNHIIKKLIGERYCITVDSDNLESSFKNWIEGRLFINLNEVAADMKARRNVKNFIKQLVTDEIVNVEIKHKDAAEVKVFANVLITSNEIFPLEVEVSDRRYTIFKTGAALKTVLKISDIYPFIQAIDRELPAFAQYLAERQLDFKAYNTALDTPEKRAIVAGTQSASIMFIDAIKRNDLTFFADYEPRNNEQIGVYNGIEFAFNQGRIDQKLLIDAYMQVFDTQKGRKRIMGDLRRLDPGLFGIDKVKNDGSRYYIIPKVEVKSDDKI